MFKNNHKNNTEEREGMIKSNVDDWGKQKFNPRKTKELETMRRACEPATPWVEFKQKLRETEREVKSDAAVNMDSSEAKQFLKQREQNYRRNLIETKRNEKTTWESFDDEQSTIETSNDNSWPIKEKEEESNTRKGYNKFGANKNFRGGNFTNKQKGNRFGNKQQFRNHTNFQNRGRNFNSNNQNALQQGNPFKSATESQQQNRAISSREQFIKSFDREELTAKQRNLIRKTITTATLKAKGSTFADTIGDLKHRGAVRIKKS